jgi:biopolymer transport protein ExbD
LLQQLNSSDRSIVIAPAKDAEVEPLVQLLALLNANKITNTQILMKTK